MGHSNGPNPQNCGLADQDLMLKRLKVILARMAPRHRVCLVLGSSPDSTVTLVFLARGKQMPPSQRPREFLPSLVVSRHALIFLQYYVRSAVG